nr:MAG TPA: hypothetical protein [Caudoviricetes sp.]
MGQGDRSRAKLRYRITRPVAHHPVSFPRNPGAQYQKLSVAGVVSLLAPSSGFEPATFLLTPLDNRCNLKTD